MESSYARNPIERVIVDLKLQVPFNPFRIVTAKGEKILVAEPEMLLLLPGEYFHVAQRSGQIIRLPRSEVVAVEELKTTLTVR